MGVYERPNSPYFWVLLERPGRKALRESSKIPIDAPSAELRKRQRQQAEEAYIARMRDLAAARYDLQPDTTPDVPTFQAFSEWYETQHTNHKRGAERERYTLTHLRAHFGPVPLDQLTAATVQEYITARTQAQKTPGTVNREVDVLKSILKAAATAGHIPASPIAGLKRLRVVKRRKKVLTQAEEDRVLSELRPVDRVLYIVAVDTLIRLGNVLNLQWEDISATHITLRDSKTGPYQVPLSSRAKAALATLTRRKGYVFPHRRQAKTDRDRRGAIRLMLKRACHRARVPYGRAVGGLTFHTATRASGATRMLRAGVDPSTVQAVGNWRDFRSMQEYLQTDDRLMRQAVNQIGAHSKHRAPTKESKRRVRNV